MALCDCLDSIITKSLKYTETVTLCNIFLWLIIMITQGSIQSSSNFLLTLVIVAKTFYQLNYGIYRTTDTVIAKRCHSTIDFFYGEKSDAKEKKSKHHCFAHLAEVQEAERVRLAPSKCISSLFNVRSYNTCCLTFL